MAVASPRTNPQKLAAEKNEMLKIVREAGDAEQETLRRRQVATEIRPAPGIMIDPARRRGKPTLEGTRITVEEILDKLMIGEGIDEIVQDWPHLTKEGIVRAIAYARQLVHQQSAEPARSENLDDILEEGVWKEYPL